MAQEVIESDKAASRIPVTILTGFLGAGKTTLLKRILSERHGEKIAVIENEFGETSVDADLLFSDRQEQIVELNNGCICCKVRGDLVRILVDLQGKRSSGEISFSRVIIETTGLADPAPVAQTFFVEDDVSRHYALDAIVTIVDAVHADRQMEKDHEALEQVAFADRLLVSKGDLAEDKQLSNLLLRLRRVNARAPIARVDFGHTDIRNLLDVCGFSLESILQVEPDFLNDSAHEHDDDVRSFVFSSRRPFHPDSITRLFQEMVEQHGTDLMRYKGVLFFAGFERRVILQGVHMIMTSDVGEPWGTEEPSSNLVFIGRRLPEQELTQRLKRCLVD